MNAITQAAQEAAARARLVWAAGQAEGAKADAGRAVGLLLAASRHHGLGGDGMAAQALEQARAAHRALGEILEEFGR